MPTYISLLRGINVGRHKRMKMERLRASFEALGFEQVKTYIQSGNVVFKSKKIPAKKLSSQIEEAILKDFGFSASVVVRTFEEICAAIAGNPFLKEREIDLSKLHVTFLSAVPEAAALKKLEALIAPPDRMRWVGETLYFFLPNGVSPSVLMKHPVDRILSVVTTTRNWKTVNSVHQMCQDCN
jgi:uncharacterized protein (DUF1697 family)